jgi:hypothetical protein
MEEEHILSQPSHSTPSFIQRQQQSTTHTHNTRSSSRSHHSQSQSSSSPLYTSQEEDVTLQQQAALTQFNEIIENIDSSKLAALQAEATAGKRRRIAPSKPLLNGDGTCLLSLAESVALFMDSSLTLPDRYSSCPSCLGLVYMHPLHSPTLISPDDDYNDRGEEKYPSSPHPLSPPSLPSDLAEQQEEEDTELIHRFEGR